MTLFEVRHTRNNYSEDRYMIRIVAGSIATAVEKAKAYVKRGYTHTARVVSITEVHTDVHVAK